jgi:hypothetical protein
MVYFFICGKKICFSAFQCITSQCAYFACCKHLFFDIMKIRRAREKYKTEEGERLDIRRIVYDLSYISN